MDFSFRKLVLAAGALSISCLIGAENKLEVERLNPPDLPKLDYLSQVVRVKNGHRFLHIAGQTAIDTHLAIIGQTVSTQADTALKNLDFALKAGGAEKRDIVQLTVFFVAGDHESGGSMTSKIKAYFKDLPLPAITYLGVPKLVADGMLVEVEGIAVLRD